MKLFQWHFGLYLIPLAFLLPTSNAQAAVNCTASMPTVNLGNITPANASNASITGALLNYKCTNTFNNSRRVYVCLAVDGGDYASTTVFPRYISTGSSNPRLAFTMTLAGGTLWSTRGNLSGGSEYKSVLHDIPGGGGTIDINVPINISLLPGNGNALSTPGVYTNDFNAGHTALTTDVSPLNGDGSRLDCTKGSQGSIRFPFKVQATVIKDCKVTANPGVISLGSEPASEKNISSNGKIGVTCTKTTPYNIGLAPMTPNPSGNTNGGGFLNGTGGNTDKVPYQLRSAVGTDGTKWGNNGSTFATLTNGVTGTSDNGSEKSHTVYVTVPSADFKPDNYSDKVTINVNY